MQAVLPGPSSQASLASMACGGDALAADERAPGAVAIWWLDGDSQVLDYDVTHVQPTQHGQPALPVPVFDAFRWAWRRCPNRHVRHTGKVGSGGSCTAVHGTTLVSPYKAL